MSDTPRITPQSWLLIATMGFVWGVSFLLIEVALRGTTPFWLAAARIGIGAVFTVSVWQWRGGALWLSPARAWRRLLVVAAFSTALPFMALSWGQQYVTSGFAGVSMAAVGLIVLPLAHAFLPAERMTLRRLAGFLIGFAGVGLLVGGDALATSGAPLERLGQLACIAAAGCYAVGSVTMRSLPPVDPVGLAALPLLFGSALVVPMAFVIEGPPPLPDRQTLLVLLVLGLVPTAAANLLRVVVVRSAGPVFMSLTGYQVPFWSVFLGILLLGEPFHISLLIALALILTGTALSQWGALRRLFARA